MDLDEFAAQVESVIAEHGWLVQGVFPIPDSVGENAVWFSYTVGVEDKGGPEFLIIGLQPDLAQVILNRAVRRCLDTGRWPEDGETLGHILDNYDLLAVRVPDSEILFGDWFNVATSRRGSREGFVGYQLVIPDADNTFVASEPQPILGRR